MQANEHLKLFAQLASEGQCLLNAEGVAIAWNPTFEKLVGRQYPFSEKTAPAFWSIFPEEIADRWRRYFHLALENRSSKFYCQWCDGNVHQVNLQPANFAETPDAVAYLSLSLLPDLKLAENALRLDHTKSYFAKMSHELRTPLVAIKGNVEMLLEQPLTFDQKQLVEPLQYATQSLLNVVNDLLDFERLEEGALTLEEEPFSLPSLLLQLQKTFKNQADRKKIALKTLQAIDMPEFVVGDRLRLWQVLSNLTANAVKFTTKGEARVTVNLIESRENEALVEFRVTDTGVGIPPERLSGIFEPFQQADPSIARRFGGSGLGLSISRKIIELFGSEITATSEVGRGSTFSFQIAFKLPNKETVLSPSTEPNIKQLPPLTGMKVLVVEDNAFNAQVLVSFLNKWRVQSLAVENGESALSALSERAFDAVLLDLQLSDMNGLDIARKIRQSDNPQLAKLPIIAMTASALQLVRQAVKNAGVNALVSKPFEQVELYEKLKSFRQLSTKIDLNDENNSISPQEAGLWEEFEIFKAEAAFLPLDLSALYNLGFDEPNPRFRIFLNEINGLLKEYQTVYVRSLLAGQIRPIRELFHKSNNSFIYIGASIIAREGRIGLETYKANRDDRLAVKFACRKVAVLCQHFQTLVEKKLEELS